MMIQKVTLSDGTELLFVGKFAYQRRHSEIWEPLDQEILDRHPVPRDAMVEALRIDQDYRTP